MSPAYELGGSKLSEEAKVVKSKAVLMVASYVILLLYSCTWKNFVPAGFIYTPDLKYAPIKLGLWVFALCVVV